jgi:signal transduction histidine kinase
VLLEENIIMDFSIYGCILYHLVSNSIKHSPANQKIKIKLEFTQTPDSDFYGILTTKVLDQGPGMDLFEF